MKTIKLAQRYVETVLKCAEQMRLHFGVDNLLAARREMRIPAQGKIEGLGMTYSFHGVGCTVETPESTVDFNFDPNGNIGGFDAYRLANFAKSGAWPTWANLTEEQIQSDLIELEAEGKIVQLHTNPNPSFYKLVVP